MQTGIERAQGAIFGNGKDDTMNNIMNKNWWRASIVRCVRTIAQTAIATIGAAAVLSEVNWTVVASASVLAGVLSLLTSVAGLPEVSE